MATGAQWLQQTSFVPLDESATLASILADVVALRRLNQRGAIIFDLDGTLYENRSRTRQIVLDWLAAQPALLRGPLGKLTAVAHTHYCYSLSDTFALAGIDLNEKANVAALKSAEAFWTARFFSDAYLHLDQPYPGAASFAQALHRAGAELFYLTGRHVPHMQEGTAAVCLRDGFPIESSNHILFKPTQELGDVEHKLQCMQKFKHRSVVAAFDNEPENIVAFKSALVGAKIVYVATQDSGRAALVGRDIYKIGGFTSYGSSTPNTNAL